MFSLLYREVSYLRGELCWSTRVLITGRLEWM